MKEIVLNEIKKLYFDNSIRHNYKQSFFKEVVNEYADFDLNVTFYYSEDLTKLVDISVDYFQLWDSDGNEVECNITDNEIIEILNY